MLVSKSMLCNGLAVALALACVACTGCQTAPHASDPLAIYRLPPVLNDMPRELSKVALPAYIIEPPDILSIEAINAIPKAPYRLRALDSITVYVSGTLPDSPIAGVYAVEPGGIVNLGVPYGAVKVAGLTVEEARAAIQEHLKKYLQAPDVSVSLAEMGAAQQIVGQYMVGPDGTVTLGSYGSVPVVGMTLEQAKAAIERHLAQYLDNPVVSLHVFSYNSKVYYVVVEGAGFGDAIYRFPITGNETVLDALTQINGLQQVSSKKIWIARPTNDPCNIQILPVDYRAITKAGVATSNYQLMPGDRVFIAEDKLVALDTHLGKILTPLERIMGFSLLGVETVTRFSGPVLKGGGNPVGTR